MGLANETFCAQGLLDASGSPLILDMSAETDVGKIQANGADLLVSGQSKDALMTDRIYISKVADLLPNQYLAYLNIKATKEGQAVGTSTQSAAINLFLELNPSDNSIVRCSTTDVRSAESLTSCSWTGPSFSSGSTWGQASCPVGTIVGGYMEIRSNNTNEGSELEVTPNYVRGRRPGGGSWSQVKAYCCLESQPPTGCAWQAPNTAYGSAWAQVSCGGGKVASGFNLLRSVNISENTEFELGPDFVRMSRPNAGSWSRVNAYCCDPSPTLASASCAFETPSMNVPRPYWAESNCQVGSTIRGYRWSTSVNAQENTELVVTPKGIQFRRANDGGSASAQAYCCN